MTKRGQPPKSESERKERRVLLRLNPAQAEWWDSQGRDAAKAVRGFIDKQVRRGS